MKKNLIATTVCAAAVTSTAFAGPAPIESEKTVSPPPVAGFDSARRPISNPTLFDLALPRTGLHAIYMHHRFPSQITLNGGGKLPMGGDLNLIALQFEYALNERLSIVAMKDGYVDFNPDNTVNFTEEEGFANLAAGLKYAFIYSPETQFVLSGSAVIEIPSGDDEVFQGEGDGSANISVQALKLQDKWQYAGSLGAQIPFDNSFATSAWLSAHVSYEVTPWFIPLIELNYFRVLDSGDGANRYPSQVGGGVPANVPFEGADVLNWGAANSDGADYATVAVGFRSRLTESVNVGLAYEFPITDEEDNITKDRFTLDLVWTF
ncbi:MAG: transporter [Verrucomicrobiae bacterium]|nr:transporter [Verrucomicrobiae bacterium]NNJ85904.1 hypothetical protein [Akkermansiaceae bacterium]